MPFIVNQKNLDKVFNEHLKPGENALVTTMAGARGVLGISDQNRVIHCNFPFFGKSTIKDEYHESEIFSCECFQKNQYTMTLIIDVKGEKKKYNSTISPLVDSKTQANKFAAIVLEQNGNTRPNYLDRGEDIVEQFSTKKNSIKITSKNILTFNKDNELEQKTPLSEFYLFDYYPGKTGSTYLYFEKKNNDKILHNISLSTDSFLLTQSNNPQTLIQNIYQLLEENGHYPYPDYLQSEPLITTVRAGTSLLGAVNPTHVLKLTSKRLIDLKPNKDGGLQEQLSLDIEQIATAKFNRHRGNTSGGAIYEIKIKMQDGSKHKYTCNEQQLSAITKLRESIEK